MSGEPGLGEGAPQRTPDTTPPADNTESTPGSTLSSELGTEAERRVSPEDAEKAEGENRKQWTEVMDSLETSTETQGKYFAKFGDKSDDPSKDSRALVLIEPYLKESPPEKKGFLRKSVSKTNSAYVVITRDGPKEISVLGRDDITGSTFIADLRKYAIEPDKYRDSKGKNGYIPETQQWLYFPDVDIPERNHYLVLSDIADPEIVQDTVKKSIESAESPYKERMETANQSAQLATDVKDMVGSLPPRT